VNAAAVENLPEPLRSYFRARKFYLVEHATDPDLLARDEPAERPHHFTEIEGYGTFPFLEFERRFVEERMGPPQASELRHGDSIWQIERFTLKLAEDFRRGRWADADHDALFAAHYAADLTQPLHTVINYDGQLTGQQGIHARFETDLVNALSNEWILTAQPAVEIADLRQRIFRELMASYSFRYTIFAADRIAAAEGGYLDARYFSTFYDLLGPLAKKRLEAAVSLVSSLWYTAWVRAGRPAPPASSAAPRALVTIPLLTHAPVPP
jgi:hypothetical protein